MKNGKNLQDKKIFTEGIDKWITKADLEDQSLDPVIRRRKWLLILCTLFALFAASFLLNPMMQLSDDAIDLSKEQEKSPYQNSTYGFEMPVDSFENHLKTNIHEKLSEKE
jgi:hypothetical protein